MTAQQWVESATAGRPANPVRSNARGFFPTVTFIESVAFILDGDFTRRVVGDFIGSAPTPADIEAFCKSVVTANELIRGVAYYDCPPSEETRRLPISGALYRFKSQPTYWKALKFQEVLLKNHFFSYRLGKLAFGGWRLKRSTIKEMMIAPRPLSDHDFEPILVQKQVDMMIGLDIAKLSSTRFVSRLILLTSDSELIPAIQVARANGTNVTIVTGRRKSVKKKLIRACDEHRDVSHLVIASEAKQSIPT